MKKNINTSNKFQVIGVSPFLISGAQGHYESFHKALLQGLQLHDQVELPLYLGSRQTPLDVENWYVPVVPSRLTSKFKVVDLKYFKTLLDLAKSKSNNSKKVFVVYEGNLFSVYLFSALIRFRPNAIATVNIFDNQQHARLFESKVKSIIFKMLLKIAIKGVENQIVLTADTSRFASRLQEATDISIEAFPMFSILQPSTAATKKSREFLVNLRGAHSANRLLEVCELVGNLNLPEITIHGAVPEHIREVLTQFQSLEFSEGHISETEYRAMFVKFKSVVFLYNPASFSYCSSGRLFDAVIAEAKLVVPSNTALSDFAEKYGNASEFDFNKNSSLAEILLGQIDFSVKSAAELPTLQNSAQNLVFLAENCQRRKRTKNFSLIFWTVSAIGWTLSLAGYLMSAAKFKIKNRIFFGMSDK